MLLLDFCLLEPMLLFRPFTVYLCRVLSYHIQVVQVSGNILQFVSTSSVTKCSLMFLRYDPFSNTYHDNIEGDGVICSAVDILPTEFAKEVQYLPFNHLSKNI